MAKTRLSAAKYVDKGYGQVEPNHLSAQLTGQIWAQLPADAAIEKLENGQFVKYDYEKGLVNFEGPGEWMLVFNEIKIYRDELADQDFAMIKGDYQARVYSPVDAGSWNYDKQSRFYGGVDAAGKPFEKVTAPEDALELHYNEDPFHIESKHSFAKMPAGTTMVPRVFKTNVGDIFTTNMVDEEELELGNILSPRDADGILVKNDNGDMKWQVVKVYDLPDRNKAVKIMRIA
jgi:hypothetical protein